MTMKHDHQLSAFQLQAKYDALVPDNQWSEHPQFVRADWQYEASEGNTQLGYWDWVVHALESEQCDNPSIRKENMSGVTPGIVHLNTILAALRHYQASGFGELLNRPADINDIATDGGNHASLHDEGIDALCEALNTGDIVLSNPKVEMSDWREDHALPAELQGTSGTIDLSKCANGDIEIISPLGEKSVLSVEFDAGVPRIHIYPPDQDAPTEQSTDEFAVTVALLPGHVLAHDSRGNGYAMYAESQRPTPAPYFDGDSRIDEMLSQEGGDALVPKHNSSMTPTL